MIIIINWQRMSVVGVAPLTLYMVTLVHIYTTI